MQTHRVENPAENRMAPYLRRPIAPRSSENGRLALQGGILGVWQAGLSSHPPNTTHLVGELTRVQLDALSSSLVSVVQRHDILTAKVEETPAETYLYLDECPVPQIEVIDLRQ